MGVPEGHNFRSAAAAHKIHDNNDSSQTTDSVTLKLRTKNPEDKTPVHGYTLHYKVEFGDWNSEQIPFGSEEFTLDDLICGKEYGLYVTAYNA